MIKITVMDGYDLFVNLPFVANWLCQRFKFSLHRIIPRASVIYLPDNVQSWCVGKVEVSVVVEFVVNCFFPV